MHGSIDLYFGDNLHALQSFQNNCADLIYIDPPFNTGKTQSRTTVRTTRDNEGGDRTGFGGNRYATSLIGTTSFNDRYLDFWSFLGPRISESMRVLKATGSFFLHMDYREVHYAKVFMDTLLGRDCFKNEIIWAYDYGARSKKRWSAKHDTILWYAKNPDDYTFNYEAMDRIPYMAPGLVGPDKAAKGKTPTDVWWHTIVPTNGKERTGYATQKPVGVLDRILRVHSRPGDRVLDYFAGSGTTGESAARLGRHSTLVDDNLQALRVMRTRLAAYDLTVHTV